MVDCIHRERIEEKLKDIEKDMKEIRNRVGLTEQNQAGTKVYITQILEELQNIRTDIKEALRKDYVKKDTDGKSKDTFKFVLEFVTKVFAFVGAYFLLKNK